MNSAILTFAVILVSSHVLANPRERREIKNGYVLTNKCLKEVKGNIDILQYEKHLVTNVDQKLKCFYVCWYKNSGWISESGEMLVEKITDMLMPTEISESNKKILAEYFHECLKIIGEDECDTVFKIFVCTHPALFQRRIPQTEN